MESLLPYKRRHRERTRAQKIAINKKILIDLIDELDRKKINYVFLIFHPPMFVFDDHDWRDALLTTLFEEKSVPYISSKKIIRKDVAEEPYDYTKYYGAEHMHPNAYQNQLIAKEIKTLILGKSPNLNSSQIL